MSQKNDTSLDTSSSAPTPIAIDSINFPFAAATVRTVAHPCDASASSGNSEQHSRRVDASVLAPLNSSTAAVADLTCKLFSTPAAGVPIMLGSLLVRVAAFQLKGAECAGVSLGMTTPVCLPPKALQNRWAG